MRKFSMTGFLLLVLSMVCIVNLSGAVYAADAPRMSKEELKGLLGSPDVIILDVRTGKDWSSSEFKIKSAIREDKKDISWADKYPKDKTIVLYCA